MLVTRPDMLGDSVTLIGRQLKTAGGPLDLLGVDQDGKLVVYELKRGDTPREAMTQAIDYASWLDTLGYDELDRRISDHAPSGLVRDVDDFDNWYSDQFAEDQVQNLRPTRIVLVGLGIESSAERMAQWLSQKGVDLEVIAFHAFQHEGRTVLARQVEVSSDDEGRIAATAPPHADPFNRAAEFDAESVMRSGYEFVDSCFVATPYRVHTFKNGFNFALPSTDDRRIQRYPGYVGVFVRTESTGMINVVIRPDAVKVCHEGSEKSEEDAKSYGAQVFQYVNPVSGDRQSGSVSMPRSWAPPNQASPK